LCPSSVRQYSDSPVRWAFAESPVNQFRLGQKDLVEFILGLPMAFAFVKRSLVKRSLSDGNHDFGIVPAYFVDLLEHSIPE